MILTRAEVRNGPEVADGLIRRIGTLTDELRADHTLTHCYAYSGKP